MKIRIQWKLTLIFCSLISIILVIIYSYTNTHLKEYLEQRIQSNLKKELILSRNIFENELAHGKPPTDLDPLSHMIGESLNLRVTIIGPNGNIESDSEMNKDELSNSGSHLDRPEVQAAIKTGFGQSKRFSTTKKIDMLYVATPLKNRSYAGFLRLSMPLSDMESVIAKMNKIIIAAFTFAFILILIFGYLISIMISKPILEMSTIARSMAKGDFSKKVYASSGDEISDLASALNYMSDEIRNKVAKISLEEAKSDAVISSMFEGVLLTNEKGAIITMNPALRKLFMISIPPEGRKPIEVMRSNRIQDIVDKIISDGHRITTEEILTNFSPERVVRISGSPVVKNGTRRGAILVFHDITELRRLEKIRRDFVANVSHELRTPLSNIKGYAETLLHGALEDKNNAKDFTNIIYKESDRLAKLIDDLLDLSKIESEKIEIMPVPSDIGIILANASAILKKSANDKHINIEIEPSKDTPKVLADESRLTQVVLNLLDNAIKFTQESGRIKIAIIKNNGFVQTDITDTGPGISEKDLPRIFERFYRVDKARSRDLGGTGLGLSIVKHIVQLHGGEVWVSSTPGKGSTFSFTIPVA